MGARKRWIAFTSPTRGILMVDSGAKEALVNQGRSLLASGVREVKGNFRRGDLVSVRDMANQEFARGLVNYPHAELEKIRGLKSEAIVHLLGRKADEVIHRDWLVLLKS